MCKTIGIIIIISLGVCLSCTPKVYTKYSSDCATLPVCNKFSGICLGWLFTVSDIIVAKSTVGIDIRKAKKYLPAYNSIEKFVVLENIKGNYKINDTINVDYQIEYTILDLCNTEKDSLYLIYVKRRKAQGVDEQFQYPIHVPKRYKKTNRLCELTTSLFEALKSSPNGQFKFYYPNTNDLFLKGYVKNGNLYGRFYCYYTHSEELCIGVKPKTFAFYKGYIDKYGNGSLQFYDIRQTNESRGKIIKTRDYTYPFGND
jgi:hypothetical protein